MIPTFNIEYIPCDFCGTPSLYRITTKGQVGMKDNPGYVCSDHLITIIELDIDTQVQQRKRQNVQDLLEADRE